MAVNLDVFNGVSSLIGKIADKIWPDPLERAKQQVRLLELEQAGEFKQIDAMLEAARQQTDINKAEAAHASVFVSGWRPAVGWVCVATLACNFIAVPLLAWASTVIDPSIPAPPRLEMAELFQVLLGMLGLGGLRTYERLQGVARSK